MKFPIDPRNWDTKTKTAETRLAACLNTVVPAEVSKATLALAEGLGDIHLEEDPTGREPSYSRSVMIIFQRCSLLILEVQRSAKV